MRGSRDSKIVTICLFVKLWQQLSTTETTDKLMMTEVCRNVCHAVLKTETLKSKQSEASEALISGSEIIVILPTGFGKSLFTKFTPPLSCALRQARETVRSLYSWLLGWSIVWMKQEWRQWSLSNHGRKTSTRAQTTRTKKTWPEKKPWKGGVMMHVNQRKKEFKKEYAPFYRYKCKRTRTRGQVRASLVTISETSPSVDALK